MDREITTQDDENPSTKFELSPRKPLGVAVSGGGGGDRLKRDEWSEGAVTILLEAYESKWILRNRAKLKGQDWEDVAKCVSSRSCNSKSPKTQTQCKNKIESMKKRYRSESATTDTSSWPLYSRLDHLLRGTGASTLTNHGSLPFQPPLPPLPPSLEPPQTGPVLESFLVAPPPPPPQQPAVEVAENNSHESNDVDPMVKENNDAVAEKLSDQISDKNNNHENHHVETDSSTPALYSNEKDGVNMKKRMKNRKRKRRRRDESSSGGGSWEDVAESIRWVADAVLRSEQARMDTMREVERMRVEAEAKRGEMDLKRTEIIANTQLEIARIFAKAIGKSVDSSLRIGRS